MRKGNPVQRPCQLGLSASVIVALALGGAARALGGTYYLSATGNDGGGDGSRARPWRTIRHATDSVPDDGSTVILLDGLHNGTQSVGRHFGKVCTVRAEKPYGARLRSPSNRTTALTCYNCSNVTFQGLEVFGSGSTGGEYVVHVGTARAHHIVFDDCIIHDSYNNDLVKINDFTHHVAFRRCLLLNPNDHGGDEHFDINTCTDVTVEDSILLNDYAGSGRRGSNQSHAFVVIKNSGKTSDVTKRITFRRNVFLNWQGARDETYILLGEDGKPFDEAQQVMIENNLFIHNSPVQCWGTLLLKGGLRDVTFRANTVVGHPVTSRYAGAYAVMCLRIGKNPPMGDLVFTNNIWCDPTGQMPRFAVGHAGLFEPASKPLIRNNLYWNGGKEIPHEDKDVFAPARDPKKILADPRLGDPAKGVTLPRWDPAKRKFLSGQTTIRGELERLVALYGAIPADSPAAHAADPTSMPADDILARRRSPAPDIGCYESAGTN
jgi:hypothetical protein